MEEGAFGVAPNHLEHAFPAVSIGDRIHVSGAQRMLHRRFGETSRALHVAQRPRCQAEEKLRRYDRILTIAKCKVAVALTIEGGECGFEMGACGDAVASKIFQQPGEAVSHAKLSRGWTIGSFSQKYLDDLLRTGRVPSNKAA